MNQSKSILNLLVFSSLAALAVLATDLIFPNLDRQISSLFFHDTACEIWGKLNPDAPRCGLFWLDHQSFYKKLRSYLNALPIIAAVLLVITFAMRYTPSQKFSNLITKETFFAYLGSFLLGPMIVVTWILKPLWGRSRPFQSLDFGGYDAYTSFANWGYKCSGNCSFVSGEVASMAWLLLAVQILPKNLRAFASIVSLILLAIVSWGRIASGRHFATDAIFAVIVVILCHCIALTVTRKFMFKKT